ncbi:nuclear transport factor 2 family protein [Lewinella sp. 4G2]|uniref:nuclear transport factor 2 family protein n=1 Tax=Lewinella sp. 4G2 TaxID=1803372 RepID=UPI0007E051C8|nr:nuclear transport factor 2 family protein [Lewinella sp. 4G2]OAV45790.1 hypothetical protein A3850_004300 [Lewinella sp. 4G2]
MTTQQVADRLVEMVRTGKSDDAYLELFAENASSHEMPGVPGGDVQGRDNLIQKSKKWAENVAEIHTLTVTDPLIHGEFFTVGMSIDLTKKDGGRTGLEEEICVYHVRDGKIQSERFVYAMG